MFVAWRELFAHVDEFNGNIALSARMISKEDEHHDIYGWKIIVVGPCKQIVKLRNWGSIGYRFMHSIFG